MAISPRVASRNRTAMNRKSRSTIPYIVGIMIKRFKEYASISVFQLFVKLGLVPGDIGKRTLMINAKRKIGYSEALGLACFSEMGQE
jgi:hypothetical protein